MNAKHFLLIIVLVTVAACTTNAQPPSPTAPFSINTFTDDLTLLVVHVNPELYRPEVSPDSGHELLAAFAEVQAPLEEFLKRLKETGVQDFYIVCDLGLVGPDTMFFLVAPNHAGSDPRRTEALLAETFGKEAGFREMEVTRMGGAMVAAAPRILERLREGTGSDKVNWEAGFDRMEPAQVQCRFRPYDGWQRVVKELMPILPEAMGGGPSTALTRGLVSAGLAVNLLPDPSLLLKVESESAADARALLDVVLAGLDAAGEHSKIQKALGPTWESTRSAITPEVRGDGLVLSLDAEGIMTLPIMGTLPHARGAAPAGRSMDHLKQIGLAFHLYATDHDGRTPAHLADFVPYLEGRILCHPSAAAAMTDEFKRWSKEKRRAWLDDHAAYVYLPPGKPMTKITSPARLILAYEKPGLNPPSDSVTVLFADGHAERLATRDDLNLLLGQ